LKSIQSENQNFTVYIDLQKNKKEFSKTQTLWKNIINHRTEKYFYGLDTTIYETQINI